MAQMTAQMTAPMFQWLLIAPYLVVRLVLVTTPSYKYEDVDTTSMSCTLAHVLGISHRSIWLPVGLPSPALGPDSDSEL